MILEKNMKFVANQRGIFIKLKRIVMRFAWLLEVLYLNKEACLYF